MSNPIANAREAFLDMMADARRFEEAHDEGCVDHELTVGDQQLSVLCEALGIKVRHMETARDAIIRTLATENA